MKEIRVGFVGCGLFGQRHLNDLEKIPDTEIACVADVNKELVKKMGLKKWQTEKSIIDEMLARGYPDKFFRVSTEEARNMANRLCQEEGIYCGMSSGANVHVALKIAQRMKKNQNVVTVIVDRRDRYLGEYPNDVFIV